MFSRRLVVLLLAVTLAAVGCGSSDDVGSTGGPVPALPAPADEVVLTVRGGAQPNVDDEVQVDLAGIESLGTTTLTVFEPFIDGDLEVTGVRLDDVLAAAGVDADNELVWTALDGYQVHFSRRQINAEDAILATRIEGEPIDVAEGGPVRVVFTDPEGTLARDTNQWIWSLYLIEVV